MKDEAHNIPQMLKSVEGCFDEIILTDTGSTDNSVEVAKSLGARVEHFKWCDDFSAARNYSFSHAKTDFVMWLDLDDVLVNPEGFKNFRDTAMNFGDYWLANYHYSSDAQGNPACTFARERVFRTSQGCQWHYFVHEGVMPVPGTAMQISPVWAVKHMRSAGDMVKDKARNLGIFERHANQLDPRMQYYYGKELFENQKPVDAIIQLGKALVDKDRLQMHDRVLAMQYLCYAYMQTNQIEQALGIASAALLIAPHRAEFYMIIGDCYIRQNRLMDAVPSLNAAKSCQVSGFGGMWGGASPVFHSMEAYTTMPRVHLAKIYAQAGDMDKAEIEAKEAVDKFNHEESMPILAEVQRLKVMTHGFKDAKPCDDITIVCPPQGAYLWDAEIAKTKSMGGSEIAAIEMAYWLHKKSGRPVKVFNMREDRKICDGVEYIPAKEVNEYMAKHKPAVSISWRHCIKVTDAPVLHWCHDLQTQGVETVQGKDKILCLTPFHKRYMMATQGMPEDKIYLTRNGLNPTRFKPIDHSKKDPNKFVFSSSPDRGLDRTMLVLDKVREKHPNIKLHIFYGRGHLDQWGQKDLRVYLDKMVDERKDWIIDHGAVQQNVLMEEFSTAAYALQPSDFIETSMISSMEQLCCGVYQIRRAVGGCVDTMKDAVDHNMATLVDSNCITPEEYQIYVDSTLMAIEEQAYRRIGGPVADPETYSWEKVCSQWIDNIFPQLGVNLCEKNVLALDRSLP